MFMKKLSLERMEAIQGGDCMEYGIAWAEATWGFMNASSQAEAGIRAAEAVYWLDKWNNCVYQ